MPIILASIKMEARSITDRREWNGGLHLLVLPPISWPPLGSWVHIIMGAHHYWCASLRVCIITGAHHYGCASLRVRIITGVHHYGCASLWVHIIHYVMMRTHNDVHPAPQWRPGYRGQHQQIQTSISHSPVSCWPGLHFDGSLFVPSAVKNCDKPWLIG